MAAVFAQIIPPPAHSAVVVRPIMELDPKEREKILEEVEYNVFAFPAGLVICDYLSDSGTSAMTDVQWAACKLEHILIYFCHPYTRTAAPLNPVCRVISEYSMPRSNVD